MGKVRTGSLLCLVVLLLTAFPIYAQAHPEWTTPLAPFRIADNLYYVGSRDLASYLIVTPDGDILINSNLKTSPPLIQRSVQQLGFRFTDIKILLISHAHFDHDAGSAEIIRRTHARYMVMDDDVPVVESGGAKDFAYPNDHYPAAKVDRILHDGDQVKLGGVVLVAHKTAGHTRGCTTWTMQATDQGRLRNVVIVGSWNVNSEFRLADRKASAAHSARPASYPGIAADYQRSFATLQSLPCDIFLGAHGAYFGMLAKLEKSRTAAGQDAWLDPDGYRAAVREREHAFQVELNRQQNAP